MQKVFQYLEEIPKNKKSNLLIVLLSIALVPTLSSLLYTYEIYKELMDNQLYFIVIVLVINSTWLFLLYFLLKRDSLKLKHLSLTWPEIRKGIFLSFVIFIAVNVALAFKFLLLDESLLLTDKFSTFKSAYKALRLFIFNIFTMAFVEEVLCRAYVIPQVYLLLRLRIKHKVTAILVALLLTQLLFALAHLPGDLFRFDLDVTTLISRQSELFMSGIILSLVYLRTRNVTFLAIFHAFMNYGLPIIGSDSDFKLFYMLAAFTLVVFWETTFRSDRPDKQCTAVA